MAKGKLSYKARNLLVSISTVWNNNKLGPVSVVSRIGKETCLRVQKANSLISILLY